MGHLLVTNDYPPKIGGIQSYLYELWRRIPPDRVTVVTTANRDAQRFDAQAPHRIVRLPHKMLLPTRSLAATVRSLAKEFGASLVVLDPVFPLGVLGPRLGIPYAVVLHGAEVVIPARIPIVRSTVARTIRGARLVVAAGNYPAREAQRTVREILQNTVVIPPGVDSERFHPASDTERHAARERLGISDEALVVASVSRLVPRKGMDVLIEVAARLAPTHPELVVVIGGMGRDERRLRSLVERHHAPVRLLGDVQENDLASLYGAADVFVMLARNRWLGLEQEGFGMVYTEAGACGVAQVAGRSGGTIDAVIDGETGLVVDRPADVVVASRTVERLLDDAEFRGHLGHAARERVVKDFDYDLLAQRLDDALSAAGG